MTSKEIYLHRTYRTRIGFQYRVDDIDFAKEEVLYTVVRGSHKEPSSMVGKAGRVKLSRFAARVESQSKSQELRV